MYTRTTGSPSSPAVLFLHGGPLSGKMWQPVTDLLPDVYCVAADMPGHGESRSEAFTLKKAAFATADWIRRNLPEGKATVVGHSLGGAVTLTLLKEAPEVVERAMVSGTAAGLSRWLGEVAILSARMLSLYRPQTLARMTIRQMRIPAPYHPLVADDLLLSADVEYNRLVFRQLMEMPLPPPPACPLLVCVGSKETPAAKDSAKKLLELYPAARGIEAQDLGHVWMLENPALFAATLRAWLHNQPMPSGITARN